MKVIATKPGFFGRLINEGETFDVPNGAKASWFEPAKKVQKAAEALESPEANAADRGGESLV